MDTNSTTEEKINNKPEIPKGFVIKKTPSIPEGFVIKSKPIDFGAYLPLPYSQRTPITTDVGLKEYKLRMGMATEEEEKEVIGTRVDAGLATKEELKIFEIRKKIRLDARKLQESELSEKIQWAKWGEGMGTLPETEIDPLAIPNRILKEKRKKDLEEYYKKYPYQRPREYENFIEDVIVNSIGGTEGLISHFMLQSALIRKYTPLGRVPTAEIWGISGNNLKEMSAAVYEDAMTGEYSPSVEGGWKGFVSNVTGRNIPFWATAAAATYLTGSGWAAIPVSFTMEGGEAYRIAKMYGATDEEAVLRMVVVGSIAAPIEAIQMGKLHKFAKTGTHSAKGILKLAQARAWKKIALMGKNVTLEYAIFAGQESLQEVLQEIPQFYSEATLNPEAYNEFWERFSGAALGGGIMSVIFGTGGRVINGTQIFVPSKKNLSKALQEKGISKVIANDLIERAAKGEEINKLNEIYMVALIDGKTLTQIEQEVEVEEKVSVNQQRIIIKQMAKEIKEATKRKATLEEKQTILQKYGEQLDVVAGKKLADIKTEEEMEEFVSEIEEKKIPIEQQIKEAQGQLATLREPIPVIREGMKQAEISAVEAEVATREQAIKEALDTLLEAQFQKIEEAKEIAKQQKEEEGVLYAVKKVFTDTELELETLNKSLQKLVEDIPVISEGKILANPDVIASLVEERRNEIGEVKKEIQEAEIKLREARGTLKTISPQQKKDISSAEKFLEKIGALLKEADKIIPVLPPKKEKIIDVQTAKNWGIWAGLTMGIDITGLKWTINKIEGKRGISAYQSTRQNRIHLKIGTRPVEIETQKGIDWAWHHLGLEVRFGDKIYPNGGLNTKEGNEYLKRVIIHELTHIPQQKSYTKTGKRRVHPTEFQKAVQKETKRLLEEIRPGERTQQLLDEGGDEAVKNISDFLGLPSMEDLDTTDFDNPFFTRLIDGMLKKFGFIDKDLNTPFVPKDFRLIKRHLWMPDYIAKKYSAFRPLYNAVRARTVARTDLAHLLDAQFAPYSQLSTKERRGIDKVLSEADLNPKDWPKFETSKGIAKLKEAGLSDNQIEAAIAWENTFSVMDRLLLEKMKNAGIDKKLIEEYQGKHKHYIPHRWYGQWVIQVKDAEGKTIYQNATKTQINAAAIATKLKAQYPDQEVKYRKFSELPENLFQEAQQPAVKAMLNDIFKRMNLETLDVDDATKTDIKNSALAALTEAYKEKGFGRAFMKRTGVPGYTTDLLQPAAEYINGFTGYITKIDLVRNLSDGLRGMDKKNYPKLFSYALEYAKYNQGRASEFQTLKKFAYVMYLYGNVSAGALNLTQSFILGWPELSKYTGGSLTKTIQSIAEVASDSLLGSKFITQEEWNKIARFRVEGYLEPRQTLELSGATGNLWLKPLNRKISKTLKFFDIFRQMETLNREAMALALIRSGIEADTPVEASWGETIPGGQLIDSAHFRYGKENRPGLMRGITSPVMVFRSWGLHYLFWAKTQIDASIKKDGKAAGALARSATALAFFGGFSAFFPAQFITWLWRRVFRTDLEAELIESLGTLGLALSEGIPAIIPPGISFSQRVSATQIPTPRDFESWKKAIQTIGGVFTDIPIRVANMKADIALGDWTRALEDISPQALRNVLAGNRLRTEGMTKRTGTPVMNVGEKLGQLPLKLTLPESILKMLGWQPSVLSNQWKITDIMRVKTDIERKQVSNWANRWNLALMSGDKEEIKTIYNEFITWNQKMKRLGRIEDMIEFERLIEAISRRQNPNIPWPEYMDDHYKMLRKQFFGDKGKKKK